MLASCKHILLADASPLMPPVPGAKHDEWVTGPGETWLRRARADYEAECGVMGKKAGDRMLQGLRFHCATRPRRGCSRRS